MASHSPLYSGALILLFREWHGWMVAALGMFECLITQSYTCCWRMSELRGSV